MSSLSGQQISNTYDGLLKLSDSTTGITSTFQAIEDGLGNNTNSRISTNGITSPNITNIQTSLVPDFMGNGFATTASVQAANTQNKLLYNVFYDTGVHSYSAITYNLNLLSSTNDIVDFYIYSLQLVPGYGASPKDLIMSGITLESSSPSTTGLKTTLLPSTLSFSGTGGGWYIYAYYVSNSGITPTVRYNVPATAPNVGKSLETLGYYLSTTGIECRALSTSNSFSTGTPATINNLAVQASYSTSDITNNWAFISGVSPLGFVLRVIK